jgi:hypothetical protein
MNEAPFGFYELGEEGMAANAEQHGQKVLA